ncbi:MAG: hypothetical protein ACI4UE_00940 [Candidatus Scatovivens sp.]
MERLNQYFLNEKDFTKKIEKVYYFAKKKNLFFDKSTIMKAELTRMFVNMMNLDVDENEVITASLIYSLKRVDSPLEIQRLKEEIYNDRKFIRQLGFSLKFSKYCTQYSRIIEDEKRENESDILELIDQFGGMILHRENRLAYSVKDALDLIENKNLLNKENRYLEEFLFFADAMENIKISGGIGVLSKFQKEINRINKLDISAALRIVYDLRDSLEDVIYFRKTDLFEENVNYINLLKKANKKTIELFEYNKKKIFKED